MRRARRWFLALMVALLVGAWSCQAASALDESFRAGAYTVQDRHLCPIGTDRWGKVSEDCSWPR